jgi:hypothetical protein
VSNNADLDISQPQITAEVSVLVTVGTAHLFVQISQRRNKEFEKCPTQHKHINFPHNEYSPVQASSETNFAPPSGIQSSTLGL